MKTEARGFIYVPHVSDEEKCSACGHPTSEIKYVEILCSICEKPIRKEKKIYEELIAKSAKPLCEDCGWDAFFGFK